MAALPRSGYDPLVEGVHTGPPFAEGSGKWPGCDSPTAASPYCLHDGLLCATLLVSPVRSTPGLS